MNLKKEDANKTRYCVQYDDHSRMMCTVLCSLMEHQSLVDLAIRCGNNTIHAHKCVLAANSPYFREQLEKNSGTEQIVINGLDFIVVKSIVEFMYCGETNVGEDNFKFMVAASKSFQIRGIQALAADSHYESDDSIQIPPPIFLSKKPKYSSTYLPVNNLNLNASNGSEKINMSNDSSYHRKLKRKFMHTEAERACAKEAAASRLALEALQKELATTDQISSFVIEESCTETTVENFIPHTDESFMENLNQLEGVPLQVVNYTDLNTSMLNNSGQLLNLGKPILTNAVLQYGNNIPKVQESAADKLKQILGGDIPSNVEIMFKTSDGNFVTLTDEVLQNITRESLQYQVIDEHGCAGEVQQLSLNIKDTGTNNDLSQSSADCEDPIAKYVNPIENMTAHEHSHLHTEKFEASTSLRLDDISDDQSILESIIENEKREAELKNSLVGKSDANLLNSSDVESSEFEISAKNLQKNKIDSLKKKTRKLRTMNACSDRQFCDEFLNTSVELSDDSKDIYNTNLNSSMNCIDENMKPCIDNVESLVHVGDNLLNNIQDIDVKVLEDTMEDSILPHKRIKVNSNKLSPVNEAENMDIEIIEYSPRKTRSNRQLSEFLSPNKNEDIKFFENDSPEKYDMRTRKMVTRKKTK